MSKNKNNGSTVFRSMRLMKSRMGIYIIALVLMSIMYSLVMEVYINVVYKDLLDAAFVFDTALMTKYVIRLIIIVSSSCIICPILSYIVHYNIQKTMVDVRIKVFQKVVKLSIPYYEKTHSQEIISCLNNDLRVLERLYFWPVFRLLLASLTGAGSLVLLFYYSPVIAVICVCISLITTLINVRYAKKIKKYAKNIQALVASLTGVSMDELNSFKVSRIYNIRSFLRKKYDKYNEENYCNQINLSKQQGQLTATNNLLNYCGYILICFICLYLMWQGKMTAGETVACIELRGGIEFFANEMGSILSQIQICNSGAERVFKLLDQEEEALSFECLESKQSETAQVAVSENEIVKFKDVCFGYNDKARILDKINCSIERGKKIAIIGESGGGKSTLTKLLLGFYSFNAGEIYYEGVPIEKYSKEEVRDKIAYVPQEPTLFNDTIRNNIGLNEVDDSKIIEAAKKACIHDFIMELPEQYNTAVGDNGTRLSGGQKQRIAIARAFLKPADIIIFDESTSAVEQELEAKIMNAIQEISEDKTIIFVTHRLQILAIMDKVIQINNHTAIETMDKEAIMNRDSAIAN